jgi:hypothetical protein
VKLVIVLANLWIGGELGTGELLSFAEDNSDEAYWSSKELIDVSFFYSVVLNDTD